MMSAAHEMNASFSCSFHRFLSAVLLPSVLLVLAAGIPSIAARSASVSAVLDLSRDRHPVSSGIYGTNGAPDYMVNGRITGSTRMGGGDPTTAYNWRIDADNAGFDWYFQQRPRAAEGAHSAVSFVNASLAAGATAFVDVSIIGHVAASRNDCYSFPVSRFPGQAKHLGDMGNGLYPNGSTVGSIHGPQLQCYIPSSPQDIVDFVTFLISHFGRDAVESSVVIQCDNEPEWWSQQHQDMHPLPYTYDELWNRTRAHAVALKAAYPKVKIAGFVMGGWAGMYCSGVDGASIVNACPCNAQSPPSTCHDFRAHGNQYLWPWLLSRINEHKLRTGVQLIDVMDHHWYTFDNGLRDDSSPLAQAQLLNQTRNLYDWEFIDPTGLLDPVGMSTRTAPAIIPRVRSWIREYAPNCSMEVAITEYNFGDDSISTAALSMAEAFAIMAREGLAASHRFAATRPSSPPFQSYLLYRNYDAKGSQVTGDSVFAAAAADRNYLTVYAQHDAAQSLLFVKLFNKDGDDEVQLKVAVSHVQLTDSGSDSSTGQLYQFQALHGQRVQLAAAGTVNMTLASGNTANFLLSLPVRTATLVVFPGVSQAMGDASVTLAE